LLAELQIPRKDAIHLNNTLDAVILFQGATGPSSFGLGGLFAASSVTNGVAVDEEGNLGVVAVPVGYVSGTPLGTSTLTFNGKTLAALGVIDGTYKWTWGTGADADSFTLQIGPVTTPEPASLALLAVGLAGLGVALRRRA
jgi:hypothetical protein